MLSTSTYPTYPSPAPFNTHSQRPARRPKLTLQMPALSAAASAAPTSAYPPRTPLSPTSRNTQANARLFPRAAGLTLSIPQLSDSSDSESDSETPAAPYRMSSAHHPITPQTGFFPKHQLRKGKKSARVAFSEDVTVYYREFDDQEYHGY